MSGLPLGAPVRRAAASAATARVFDHIPRLRQVLAHGGWPGAIYAQVCIHNLKAARERTERPAHLDELHGGSIYYTIAGPKGMAQVALVGSGDVIPGASPESGNRMFFTDGEIGDLTGLAIQYPIWLRPQPDEHEENGHARRREVESAPGADREDQAGAARVRRRKPSQRVQSRPRGPVAEASGGDRPLGGRPISEAQVAARKAASERMKAYHAARRK